MTIKTYWLFLCISFYKWEIVQKAQHKYFYHSMYNCWLITWWVQAGEQLVRVNQDTRLNYRVLDMRTPANQGIFRIQCQVGNASSCPFWIMFFLKKKKSASHTWLIVCHNIMRHAKYDRQCYFLRGGKIFHNLLDSFPQ